jgi:hypothetical protein
MVTPFARAKFSVDPNEADDIKYAMCLSGVGGGLQR